MNKRQVDAKVAEAMGFAVTPAREEPVDIGTLYYPAEIRKESNGSHYEGELPHYSTDISAAWQVVEWMNQHGWHSSIHTCPNPNYCWVEFDIYSECNQHASYEAEAVASLAICLAFLQAMGVEVPE